MRRILIIAFLLLSSCSTSLFDGMSARGVVHVKPLEDCRVIASKGETRDTWILMDKAGAVLLVSKAQLNKTQFGVIVIDKTSVCGAWKDKEPEAQQQKLMPPPDCFWKDDPRCTQPNKA